MPRPKKEVTELQAHIIALNADRKILMDRIDELDATNRSLQVRCDQLEKLSVQNDKLFEMLYKALMNINFI